MSGFAYKVPKTEDQKQALQKLLALTTCASFLADSIGLYINGEQGFIFFSKLWEALERSGEKE